MRGLVIVMISLTHALAQTWVDQRAFISQGRVTLRMSALMNTGTDKKLGGFAWLQTEKTLLGKKKKDYGQGYAGVTYYFWPWLQVAGGVGLEDAENPARAGGFVWVGNKKHSVLFIPEYGGSGFWWKMEANRKLNKRFGIGILTERFKGTGTSLQVKIPKTPFVLWVVPMFEKRRVNGLFSVRWNI